MSSAELLQCVIVKAIAFRAGSNNHSVISESCWSPLTLLKSEKDLFFTVKYRLHFLCVVVKPELAVVAAVPGAAGDFGSLSPSQTVPIMQNRLALALQGRR